MYVSLGQGILVETDWARCDHALYDIYKGVRVNGLFHLIVGSTSVPIFAVYLSKLQATAFYISLEYPLLTMQQAGLQRISRIQFGPTLFPYGPVYNDDIVKFIFHNTKKGNNEKKRDTTLPGEERHGENDHNTAMHSLDCTTKQPTLRVADFPTIHAWLTGSAEPPITKVSGTHLRHITVKELREFPISEIEEKAGFTFPALEKLARADMHEAMFVGILVWAMVLSAPARAVASTSGIWRWKYDNVTDFSKRIKNSFSLRLKALQNLLPLDLTPFFELEVLVNRGIGEIDWKKERSNRVNPNVVTAPKEEIYLESKKLFTRLVANGARPNKLRWETHWARRWQWAPTGAFHSQYPEDSVYMPEDNMLKHKFFCITAMPELPFSHFFDRKPQIVAWPSVKYEWGKMRAIYGVDNTNFIMASYGLAGCEEVLEKLFPIGKAANADTVRKTVRETLRNGIPYCFDFEDFNSQHSTESMQYMLRAYYDVFHEAMTPEQKQAFSWMVQSLEDVNIFNLGGTSTYTANGTLLSGWRLTTFVNTILNYVYTKLATRNNPIVTTHNGDDVLAAVTKLSQVRDLEFNAQRLNIRYQYSKCFLGSIAEFLRVDHNEGTGAQYLSRAVATFVHGPTESIVPNDEHAHLSALYTRATELKERQADTVMVDKLFETQLRYTASKYNLDVDDLKIVIETHQSRGGLSTEITEHSLAHKVTRKMVHVKHTDPEKEQRMKRDENKVMPGIVSYSEALCSRYKIHEYKHKIMKVTKNAVLSRSVRFRYRLEINRELPDDETYLHANLYGLLRGFYAGLKVNLAKAYGIPLFAIAASDTEFSRLLAGYKDPFKAISLLA